MATVEVWAYNILYYTKIAALVSVCAMKGIPIGPLA